MKQYDFNGYKRINKIKAKRLYNSTNMDILIVPCNIRPDNMHGIGYMVSCEHRLKYTFETIYNSFSYYNCNHETGYYPAFYVKEV